MAKLTNDQLNGYLDFINKCKANNFNLTSNELNLLTQINIACFEDAEIKSLIDSLNYEQHESNRKQKVKKYLEK